MDAFKTCQLLQTFIGKNSSSAEELFELFLTAVKVNDLLRNSSLSYQKASPASRGDNDVQHRKTDISPVGLSKRILASILDYSLIEIDLKVSLFYQFWVKRLLLVCVGEKIASVIREHLSGKGVPPVTLQFKFRFTENCELECHHISLAKSTQRGSLDLQSLMAYASINPPLTLDWGVHKYNDPRSASENRLPGSIKDPNLRIINLGVGLLKTLVRVYRSMNRYALRCTPRLLDHIQTRISLLERLSECWPENHMRIVEQLELKKDYFVEQQISLDQPTSVQMLGEAHRTIDLSKTLSSMKEFGWHVTNSGLLEKLAVPFDGSDSTPQTSHHVNVSSRLLKPDPPKARFTILNFSPANLFQVFLLAVVTEIFFILNKLSSPFNSIFDPIIAFALTFIKPSLVHDDHLQSWKPKVIQNVNSHKSSNISFAMSSAGIDALNSILQMPSTIETKATSNEGKFSRDALDPIGQSDLLKTIKFPKNVRSVSWGATPSQSRDPIELDTKFVLKENQNRKLLPKSPNPKAQMGLSPRKAAISKPKIDPIQSFSQGLKARSFELKGTAEKAISTTMFMPHFTSQESGGAED